MKMTGNTMFITGGGSGIGRALAERFHAAGNRVIVAGRRREALDAVLAACPGMVAVTLDVGDPASIAGVAAWLAANEPGLNVLVNNAGMMKTEDLAAGGDPAVAEATVVTNLLGPIRLTAALMPQLRAATEAAIVMVTSGLAFVPMVTAPTYSATKAAMHSWTVSLRQQVQGRIEVIELVPPAVQTDLTPGQASNAGYLPLADFADEVMALWRATPTPAEILVERVQALRHAETHGQFDLMLAAVNGG